MKPYIRIELNQEDKREAERLYRTSPKHHIRQKSQALLLSDSGKIASEIGAILDFKTSTILGWFHSWRSGGFSSFIIKSGRGLKPKLSLHSIETVMLVKKSQREPIEFEKLDS